MNSLPPQCCKTHGVISVCVGLPVQEGGPAEGLEAALVRPGLDQARAAVLRHQGGPPLQGRHRLVGGEDYTHCFVVWRI